MRQDLTVQDGRIVIASIRGFIHNAYMSAQCSNRCADAIIFVRRETAMLTHKRDSSTTIQKRLHRVYFSRRIGICRLNSPKKIDTSQIDSIKTPKNDRRRNIRDGAVKVTDCIQTKPFSPHIYH